MIRTYEVTLSSPLLTEALVAEVNASSEHAAMTRIRYYAFHEYRSPEMLTAECVAVDLGPLVREVTCEWYAGCNRPAVAHVSHPVLGDVPTCQHCIDRHDLSARVTS